MRIAKQAMIAAGAALASLGLMAEAQAQTKELKVGVIYDLAIKHEPFALGDINNYWAVLLSARSGLLLTHLFTLFRSAQVAHHISDSLN